MSNQVNLSWVTREMLTSWRKNTGSAKEAICANASIPAPEIKSEKFLRILTIYGPDFSDLTAFEYAQLHYYFGFDAVSSGNESDEIKAVLDKVKPVTVMQIYLTDLATKLFRAVSENRDTWRTYPVVFLEINRNHDNDVLSSQYFRVLAPNTSRTLRAEEFIEVAQPIAQRISSYYNYVSFKKLVEENYVTRAQQIKDQSSDEWKAGIKKELKSVVHFIEPLSRFIEKQLFVGETLWKDPNTLIERKEWIKKAMMGMLDAFELPKIESVISTLSDLKSKAPDAFNLEGYVTRVVNVLIDAVTFCKDLIENSRNGLKEILNDLGDSLDVLIAYACGFWNGIVDAIVGILDSVQWVATLIIELIFLPDILDYSKELFDEIKQLDIKFDFEELMDSIVELIASNRELIIEKVDRFEHDLGNPRIAAYHFGYMVYMVVELFLPPLKLIRVLRPTGKIFKQMANATK